jgi:pilus assembly protein Flp/PilA
VTTAKRESSTGPTLNYGANVASAIQIYNLQSAPTTIDLTSSKYAECYGTPLASPHAGGLPMASALRSFARDQSGATAIEYGLIASLIALVIIASVTSVGTKMTGTFNKVASNLH